MLWGGGGRFDLGNERGLGKVLLQGEVEFAYLEFLCELEGCVGGVVAVLFSGARYPFVNRRGIRIVTPPALRHCQSK